MDQIEHSPTENPTGAPQGEKSMGALVGSIIIIAIIVIGGIYFWTSQSKTVMQDDAMMMENKKMAPDQKTEMLLLQGTSNEIADIEIDLNATDLNNLDAELGNIDAELR